MHFFGITLFQILNTCMTIGRFNNLRQERFQSLLWHDDIAGISWEHDSSSVLVDAVNMPLFSLKFNIIANFERQIRSLCWNNWCDLIIRKRYQIIEIKYWQSIFIHFRKWVILLITNDIAIILKYEPVLFQICIHLYREIMFFVCCISERDIWKIRKLS